MGFYPAAVAVPQAAVAATTAGGYPLTITGTTSPSAALSGPQVSPSAGQVFSFDCFGSVTTTADTQTVTAAVYYGGLAGTAVLTASDLNPDSSATLTGAAVRFCGSVSFLSATEVAGAFEADLNYYPTSVQAGTATVSGAGQLVLALTPSDAAVSITVDGGWWERSA